MNSSPKNSLNVVGSTLIENANSTVIEVLPEETKKDTSSKTVLIKHDYYSSDSDHGRELLSRFLSALRKSSFTNLIVYLVDRGTLLLDKSNPLYEQMKLLSEKTEMIIASSESMEFYGVSEPDNSKVVIQSMDLISEDIVCLSDLLILE